MAREMSDNLDELVKSIYSDPIKRMLEHDSVIMSILPRQENITKKSPLQSWPTGKPRLSVGADNMGDTYVACLRCYADISSNPARVTLEELLKMEAEHVCE